MLDGASSGQLQDGPVAGNAETISDAGSASAITYLRSSKKNASQQLRETGVRKMSEKQHCRHQDQWRMSRSETEPRKKGVGWGEGVFTFLLSYSVINWQSIKLIFLKSVLPMPVAVERSPLSWSWPMSFSWYLLPVSCWGREVREQLGGHLPGSQAQPTTNWQADLTHCRRKHCLVRTD